MVGRRMVGVAGNAPNDPYAAYSEGSSGNEQPITGHQRFVSCSMSHEAITGEDGKVPPHFQQLGDKSPPMKSLRDSESGSQRSAVSGWRTRQVRNSR